MTDRIYVRGIFEDEKAAVAAAKAVRARGWTVENVYSPIPSEAMDAVMGKQKKSPVGYFTLAGGIVGFFTGILLAAFTATRWHLMVSGKPVVALVPFFIVGFEFTILFAVFGNVAGLIFHTRLPRLLPDPLYDPRCSGSCYGLVAACPENSRRQVAEVLRTCGGEVTDHGK